MATQGEEEARDYLEKHRILDLFNNITAQLVFNRPEQPKRFMIEVIERLREARTTQLDYPCIFDDSNIIAIFGMLDPTKKGFITLAQYKEAMSILGVKSYDEYPSGAESDKIAQDTFVREAKHGLKKSSSTFKQVP
ncbi:EF-hand calcium-binding domain-containing protein 10-like [Saccoglossus kowalevskii]|uniref:EF-hand calcium-binding domain-containing protein 10-like n=1 Tax=Saccoglossus kowalevskii TaxID=10224 RepID=A0ABM0GM70_SACKO|nr:PREDICTED: EF-hand calcium-binding domain-containing protein 10-like [Saccoglossus kowalevskii]